MSSLLFVYGTLKRGHSRSSLLRDEEYIGHAKTAPVYCLVDCGEFPGLISKPLGGVSVEGELWRVSAPCLSRLDEIEGLNDKLYARLPIELLGPYRLWKVETYHFLRETTGFQECGARW